MPLLHVVGTSSTNMSFSACFCFMKGETVEDYTWALQQVKQCFSEGQLPWAIVTDRELALMTAIGYLFPSASNILCSWHINKNIFARAKEYLANADHVEFCKDWQNLINSTDVTAFEESWKMFEDKYQSTGDLLDYLRRTWMPFKAKFVLSWTKSILHFGHLVTSRVEGAHGVLKSWLKVSTGDLKEVCSKVELSVNNQVRSIRHQIRVDGSSKVVSLTHPIWLNVNGRISHFALKRTSEQFEKSKRMTSNDPACTDFIWTTMGLPCSHKLKELLDSNKSLTQEDFHPHWWVIKQHTMPPSSNSNSISQILSQMEARLQEAPPHQRGLLLEKFEEVFEREIVRDPQVVHSRGRPAGSSESASSTRRQPSNFEVAETAERRKCGICKQGGHNRRTCPNQFHFPTAFGHESE